MSKISALILTKARTVERASIPLEEYAVHRGRLYRLTPLTVSTKIDGEKGAKSTEVVLFEGVPDPIGHADASLALANRIVAVNLIENVTEKPKTSRFGKWWIVPLVLVVLAGVGYGLYSMGYLDGFIELLR
jgi:hypothetical protein